VPPAGLPGVTGKLDQAIALGAGDTVEVKQNPDVAGLRTTPAGLDAEDG